MAKFCTACGNSVTAEDKFCRVCGNPLIDRKLASGQKTGYIFELQGCTPGPDGGANAKYQVVAYPAAVNQTGVRVFCSDESGVIKVDAGVSARGCLESDRALP